MPNKKIGLYWFTNDLRLSDQPLLYKASQEVDELVCLYCLPQVTQFHQHFSQEKGLSDSRLSFIKQSLFSFNQQLDNLKQQLFVTTESPYSAIKRALSQRVITHLYSDTFAGTTEQCIIENLRHDFPHLSIYQQETGHLFCQNQLPFSLENLPQSFTKFRKKVESLDILPPIPQLNRLPPMPNAWNHDNDFIPIEETSIQQKIEQFHGGELSALAHCVRYFSSRRASQYKHTRNALEVFEDSTKFSPWLANGCISARTIYAILKEYEANHGENESTYWIYFELLWREYFYWYARRYGSRLFVFSGISERVPLTSFYAHRFQQWKKGETPFPIVNACMHQLNQTGYMSNRGRQLVASCLIHELGLDWRYGAAYFESQLIDYDVASNWGNWQYLAGVGADLRGSRQFDLIKQTEIYDPNGDFIKKWRGHCETAVLDHVDMVDWPISTPNNH